MYTVSGGGMGEIVRRLVERIESSPSVDVERRGSLETLSASGGAVSLGFGDASTVEASSPIVGVGAQELFAATGIAVEIERVVANMLWLDLPEASVRDLPSVLVVTESDAPLFRVTESRADRRDGFRTVCCELDWGRRDPAEHVDAAVAALVELGVVEPGAAVEQVAAGSSPAFAHPSPANKQRFDEARSRFVEVDPPVHVVGGATTFGADTFNEQLLQGLAATEAVAGSG
jgi:hypothetical protein